MISICIPIYNFDVTSLVKELYKQSLLLKVPSEIILIDDCSENYIKKINESVCNKHTYIELDKNIGRASIRNRFIKYSKFENLLFLDCDSIIFLNDFLSNYLNEIIKKPFKVIYGGRIYKSDAPKRNKRLRWAYGQKRESKNWQERSKQANKSFMTNNFLVTKTVFSETRFDERIFNYGHEDTLYGFELKKKNISICHINNPILNGDLENNIDYINNTEKAVVNLVKILNDLRFDKDFIEDVNLLRVYFKLYKFRKIIAGSFSVFKPLIKYLLSSGFANIYMFDLYKLGFLAVKINENKRS